MNPPHRPDRAREPEDPDLALLAPDWLERLRAVGEPSPLGRLGRFVVLGEIGRGGQGIVYRVRDPSSGEVVAVKRIHPARGSMREALQALENEIRAARALSHPGVVRTLGLETDGSSLLLVMEWVDGVPLNEWAGAEGRRRPVGEIVTLVARVAEVLAHAHANGVVHRDLKPTNVLVDGAGQPHLLDFGMAKLDFDSSAATAASTRFVGTLAYAPPELVARGPAAIDARSDLYSLGVSLYELLTGRLPYELGHSISTAVEAILHGEPAPLGEGLRDARLQSIVRKALAKRSAARYPSADALLDDLRRYLRGERVHARGRLLRPLFERAAGRPIAIAVTLGLLGAGMGLGAWALGARRADVAAQRTRRVERFLDAAGLSARAPTRWSETDVAEVVSRAALRVGRDLARDPGAEARARAVLARRFAELGLWDQSADQSRRVLALLDRRGGSDPAALAGARRGLELAETLRRRAQDPAAAERAAVEAVTWMEGPGPWIESLGRYARERIAAGALDDAVRASERAVAMLDRLPDEPSVTRTAVFAVRAEVMTLVENWPEAERAYRAAIAARNGRLDLRLPADWSNLATSMLRQGRAAEAIDLYGVAAATRCDLLARQFPDVPAFASLSAAVRREGLTPEHVTEMGALVRERAPEILPLLLHTARRVAEAHASIGDRAVAEALRSAIRGLEGTVAGTRS